MPRNVSKLADLECLVGRHSEVRHLERDDALDRQHGLVLEVDPLLIELQGALDLSQVLYLGNIDSVAAVGSLVVADGLSGLAVFHERSE